MARQARTKRDKRDKRDTGSQQVVGDRTRERQRRPKPVTETKAQTGQKRTRGGGAKQFAVECYGELRKVEWPNQRQLFAGTVVVLIAVAVTGFYLWVVDEALSRFVRDVLLTF